MHSTVPSCLPACCVSPCVALRCITLRCSACSLPYLTSPSVPTYLPTLLTHPLLFPIPSHLVASAPTPHVPSRHVTKRARHKTAASLRLASLRDSSSHSKTLPTTRQRYIDSPTTRNKEILPPPPTLPPTALANKTLISPHLALRTARTHARTHVPTKHVRPPFLPVTKKA
jgi:hypothetical protein